MAAKTAKKKPAAKPAKSDKPATKPAVKEQKTASKEYTVKELAQKERVNIATVRQWIDNNKLPQAYKNEQGQWRIPADSYVRPRGYGAAPPQV